MIGVQVDENVTRLAMLAGEKRGQAHQAKMGSTQRVDDHQRKHGYTLR